MQRTRVAGLGSEGRVTEWDNIKVRDLQRFAAVIESGGFTAAAAVMGDSPKQLSRRIRFLESAVGARLFHRTTRTVTPTAEGYTWYGEVRAVLDRLQQATEALVPTRALDGLVRVQVPTLLVDAAVTWAAEQMVLHPDLALDVLVGDRSDDLLGRGIDVCISGVPPTGATMVVRKVPMAGVRLIAHRDYLAKHGVPKSPTDLVHHECLRFLTQPPQVSWALQHVDGRQVEAEVRGRFAANDSRALVQALVAAAGIGPMAGDVLKPLQRGELVEVLPGWRFGSISMFLALAPGRARLTRVRHVADALVTLCTDFNRRMQLASAHE